MPTGNVNVVNLDDIIVVTRKGKGFFATISAVGSAIGGGPHAATHENGGSDEISVLGLSGLLADDQNPAAHAVDHENGGSDEISVLGLSGLLADDQNPTAHATDHENGGSDEISVLNLSGLLADAQTPLLHASTHERAGTDQIDGDHLDIDFTPTNYTPDITPPEAANVDDLAAHLAGIDNALTGGGGDNISVNGVAATDADFDDATPAAPATTVNVQWQKDALTPNNISANVRQATEVLLGVAELATQAETDTGTDDTRIVTPLKLATKPLALHAAAHQNGGGDEINVGGLSGTLADGQNPVQATEILVGGAEIATQAETDTGTDDTRIVTPLKLATKPLALHAAAHENGGGDEISVLGLSGLLADDQNPTAHATDHENGGGDEINVVGLSGVLADAQNPVQATEILVGGAEIATQAETDTGTDDTRIVTPLKLATHPQINPSRIVSFVLEDPTAADDAILQHKFGEAVTITRVSASCNAGATCTIQFDERTEALPNTGGTDVLTAALVADDTTEATTSFANAGIAADAILNLDIDAVSGSPTVVRIHVEFELA